MVHRWLNMARNESFGGVLSRYRDAGPGFDALRILLALAIFYGHTKWVAGLSGMAIEPVAQQAAIAANPAAAVVAEAGNAGGWQGLTKPLKLALVPMFFALSGFLVIGSAIRLKATSTFLAYRALRIFPALAVEVTLSAILLGAALTTLPLHAYFTHPEFFRYMLNTVGFVQFVLPGVFAENPVRHTVNVNLWTLPSEFYCYLCLAAMMLTRVVYSRNLFTLIVTITTMYLAGSHLLTGMSAGSPYPMHVIVYYFMVGMLFYHWKDRIPANFWVFAACVPVSYFLLMDDRFIFLAPLPLVYGTLFFGLMPIPKSSVLNSGDYSYGVYLYGFPIAQSLVAVWPDLFVRNFPALMAAATTLTCLFAAFSWHAIEKHALGYKKRLPGRFFPTSRPQ
jgi:peptidoglycan/LPS O-acetylase OafA/YrhL